MKKILVTGAVGQIGSELTIALREKYGSDSVVAVGHKTKPSETLVRSGQFEIAEITKKESLEELVKKHHIDTIYHMAAILSVTGENNPQLAWNVNMNGLYNVLEIAREHKMIRVFSPSSIAAFGQKPLARTLHRKRSCVLGRFMESQRSQENCYATIISASLA